MVREGMLDILGALEADCLCSCSIFLLSVAVAAVQSSRERMGQRQLFRQQQQQQRWQQRLPEAQQRGGVGPRVHTQEQEILLGTYLGAETPVCSGCVRSQVL